MNHSYRDRILTLLYDHRLIDTLSDAVLGELDEQLDITGILAVLFTDRSLWFDAAIVYSGSIFEHLVEGFAQATLGEWIPEQIHSALEGGTAVIDFDNRDKHTHWEFAQDSIWVPAGFLDAIEAFARANLSGAFVQMPTMDYSYNYVYLPKAVATELHAIKAEIKRKWPGSEDLIPLLVRMVRREFWLWYYVKEQGNDFRFLNVPDAQGELPLHVVIKETAQGAEQGMRILKHLLRKGASSTLVDGHGRTAFDVATGHQAILAVLEEAVAQHGEVQIDAWECLRR